MGDYKTGMVFEWQSKIQENEGSSGEMDTAPPQNQNSGNAVDSRLPPNLPNRPILRPRRVSYKSPGRELRPQHPYSQKTGQRDSYPRSAPPNHRVGGLKIKTVNLMYPNGKITTQEGCHGDLLERSIGMTIPFWSVIGFNPYRITIHTGNLISRIENNTIIQTPLVDGMVEWDLQSTILHPCFLSIHLEWTNLGITPINRSPGEIGIIINSGIFPDQIRINKGPQKE